MSKSFVSNTVNTTSQIPLSSMSIENKDVGDKPVYLGNLIRMGD